MLRYNRWTWINSKSTHRRMHKTILLDITSGKKHVNKRTYWLFVCYVLHHSHAIKENNKCKQKYQNIQYLNKYNWTAQLVDFRCKCNVHVRPLHQPSGRDHLTYSRIFCREKNMSTALTGYQTPLGELNGCYVISFSWCWLPMYSRRKSRSFIG